MSMSAPRSHGGDDLPSENHEINVTPFIDVMLVLLIIFMVAAPLATVQVPVDLPAANAPPAPKTEKPITLSVAGDLTLSIGEISVTADSLRAELDKLSGGDVGQRIFLRADKAVAYGEVMEVMNTLRDAGYLKVALVGLDAGRG
ncbi:MAG: TonB system transport protein ExbD [Gammaproteobacteria bacterium]|nr:TonB system transport protein ExbD [Gammaproteobacteria bacterium]MBQ0774650.1 TonB system transport protein ExbD [Gammaproteobacteria bacterium]